MSVGAGRSPEQGQLVSVRSRRWVVSDVNKSGLTPRPPLEARKNDRTEGLKKLLQDRANKEVSDITAILNELRQAIEGQLDDPYYRGNYLPGFAPAEQEQFERNVDALRGRLTEIPGEIKKETEAIRARFADPQPRMFPVAVTFLVPRGMARV
jgi:hypothetical protein